MARCPTVDLELVQTTRNVNGTRQSVRKFQPGKRDHLFRFSTFSGNFPVGRTDETCSIYRRAEPEIPEILTKWKAPELYSFFFCSRHWRFVLQTEISGKYNSRLHFFFLYILLAIIRYTYYSVAVKAHRHVLCDFCRHFIGRSYVAVFSAMSLRRNFLTLPQASFKDIYHF